MALQFKINNVDYSQYVVLNKYNLQRSAEYGGTQYTDGWWKKHRNIVRHSISGTVTLAFPSAAYVNNENNYYIFNAFLTPTTRTAITPIGLNPAFFAVTLKVEEQ